MARRRYYRYPRRTVAKKKWASNYKSGTINTTADNQWTILVENKAQADAPTPTIIKTGNFKVQGDCYITNLSAEAFRGAVKVHVLFVPEGWANADIANIPAQHPEWILCWCVVDTTISNANTAADGNKFSMTSRLKRNLNSGDKIVIQYQEIGFGSNVTAHVYYTTQFWTCAN